MASRRASEQIIREGRVHVNGQPVLVLGSKVDPERDKVTLDGKPAVVIPYNELFQFNSAVNSVQVLASIPIR